MQLYSNSFQPFVSKRSKDDWELQSWNKSKFCCVHISPNSYSTVIESANEDLIVVYLLLFSDEIIYLDQSIILSKMGFNQTDRPMLVSTGAPFLLGLSYVASLYVIPFDSFFLF